jgi:hypothetical protein
MSDNQKLAAILRGQEGQQAVRGLQQNQVSQQQVGERQGPVSPTHTSDARSPQAQSGRPRARVKDERAVVRPPPVKQPDAVPQAAQQPSAASKAQQLRSPQAQAPARAPQKGREAGR